MNLIVLVLLILGGLVLIDILLRFGGNRAGARLTSEQDVIEQLRREYPDVEISESAQVFLTSDRTAAFVPTGSGATGFVCGFGDRFIVRQLHPADIKELACESERALKISFREVTLRPKRFEFANNAARDFVFQRLTASAAK